MFVDEDLKTTIGVLDSMDVVETVGISAKDDLNIKWTSFLIVERSSESEDYD